MNEAVRVQVPNEGLVVYLSDASHLARIKAAMPAALWAGGSRTDLALRTLAKEGALVAFELFQDDDLDIAVRVGSATPQPAPGWAEPRVALLDLPSGELCVDSGDTAAFHPEATRKKKSGRARVPPGRYLVTVERRSPLSEGEDGPPVVLTLAPTTQTQWDAAVPELTLDRSREPAPTEATVVDGACTATVLQRTDAPRPSIALGLDDVTLEALGVRSASGLELSWGESRAVVVHLGWLRNAVETPLALGADGVRALVPGAVARCHLESSGIPAARHVDGRKEWLRIEPFAAEAAPALLSLTPGTAVRVQAVPDARKKAALPKAKLVDGGLQATVLSSHPAALTLALDFPTLRKLKGDTDFQLTCAEGVFPLHPQRLHPMDAGRVFRSAPEDLDERIRLSRELAEKEKQGAPEAEVRALAERVDALTFGPGVLESRPLGYSFIGHWGDPEKMVMVLQRLCPVRTPALAYAVPRADPGTQVTLRVAPPAG